MGIKMEDVERKVVFKERDVEVDAVGVETEEGMIKVVAAVFKNNKFLGSVETLMNELAQKIDAIKNFKVLFSEADILSIIRAIKTVYEDLPVIPCVKGCGWQKKGEKIVSFLGAEHVSMEGNSLPMVITPTSLSANGDFEVEMAVIQDYVTNLKRQTVFCAALASVICGYLGENLLISLVGQTSTGKSTLSDFVGSMFTRVKNGVTKQKFNATENALIKRLDNNTGVVAIIDDTSLAKIKDMTSVIYQIAEGCDRDRLGKQAALQEVREWATSIIFTAEESVLFSGKNELKGKVARMIEINVTGSDLFDNGEEATYIAKIANENYGLIGTEFVKRCIMEKAFEKLEEKIAEHKKNALTYFGDYNNGDNIGIIDRLARKIAFITVTAELANRVFDFRLEVSGICEYLANVCMENIRTFDDLCEEKLDFEGIYRKFMESLHDYAEIHPDFDDVLFVTPEMFKNFSYAVLDKVKVKNIKEWKNLLKQNGCLKTKGDDFGYRTENQRYYALRKPEVVFNGR